MNQTAQKSESTPSRWSHRVALLLTAVVFPLIWLGGLVTTSDAGMAVPDWPNTYNYNMFAYPVRDWFFGPWDLFVEHGHRLLATLAGLVAILLVVVTFRSEPRRWVRWFSAGALALVIFQGLLGGFRVLLDARVIAKIHGCVGPLFFAYSVAFCVVTSKWWLSRSIGNTSGPELAEFPTGQTIPTGRLRWMGRFAIAMLTLSFLQLVLGAFLRHIEVTASPTSFMHLVLTHVVFAVLLMLGTFIQWLVAMSKNLRGRGIRTSINALALLVTVQVGLGVATWVVKYGWPVWFENFHFAAQFVIPEKSFLQMNLVTAHVAVGSLILGFWTVHTLRCRREWNFWRSQLEESSLPRSDSSSLKTKKSSPHPA